MIRGLGHGAAPRSRWGRGLLLAMLACVGCTDKTSAPAPAPSSTTVVENPPHLPPSWVADAARLYASARAKPPPPRAPFGRVQASLAIVADNPAWKDCPPASNGRCTLQGHVYVRAEPIPASTPARFQFSPQCTALQYDEILEPAERHGPWQLASGAFAPASTVKLHGQRGAVLTLNVERWTAPGPLPPPARDAWLHARSLIVAHAATFGVTLDVDGWSERCSNNWSLHAREACHATRGGPLAMLMDPAATSYLNGEPDWRERPPHEMARERVLAPVRVSNMGWFSGRLSADQLRVTCAQLEARMRPFANALLASGVDLVRLVLGSILTDGDLVYPQISLRQLAQILECLGFAGVVRPALDDLAAIPSLDWQNRFRAGCLARLLAGADCDAALLQQMQGGDSAPGDLGDADKGCVDVLMGQFNL